MIIDFACKETELLFHGKRVLKFMAFERAAMRKLQQLHAATNIDFLRIPTGNHLEALSGKRKGQYSIRINDQWRICFRFANGEASQVEIIDYH